MDMTHSAMPSCIDMDSVRNTQTCRTCFIDIAELEFGGAWARSVSMNASERMYKWTLIVQLTVLLRYAIRRYRYEQRYTHARIDRYRYTMISVPTIRHTTYIYTRSHIRVIYIESVPHTLSSIARRPMSSRQLRMDGRARAASGRKRACADSFEDSLSVSATHSTSDSDGRAAQQQETLHCAHANLPVTSGTTDCGAPPGDAESSSDGREVAVRACTAPSTSAALDNVVPVAEPASCHNSPMQASVMLVSMQPACSSETPGDCNQLPSGSSALSSGILRRSFAIHQPQQLLDVQPFASIAWNGLTEQLSQPQIGSSETADELLPAPIREQNVVGPSFAITPYRAASVASSSASLSDGWWQRLREQTQQRRDQQALLATARHASVVAAAIEAEEVHVQWIVNRHRRLSSAGDGDASLRARARVKSTPCKRLTLSNSDAHVSSGERPLRWRSSGVVTVRPRRMAQLTMRPATNHIPSPPHPDEEATPTCDGAHRDDSSYMSMIAASDIGYAATNLAPSPMPRRSTSGGGIITTKMRDANARMRAAASRVQLRLGHEVVHLFE